MHTFLSCLLLTCAAFAAAPDGHRFYREFNVPGPGWYRAPVDDHIWRHAQSRISARGDNRKQLPCAILPGDYFPMEESEANRPELIDFSRQSDEAILTLRIYSGGHRQIDFKLANPDYYPWIIIEKSRDGKEWNFLSKGKLFQLGTDSHLAKTAILYPPTGERFVRIRIPLSPGKDLPSIEGIHVAYEQYPIDYPPWDSASIALKPLQEPLASALSKGSSKSWILDFPQGNLEADSLVIGTSALNEPRRIELWNFQEGLPTKIAEYYLWPHSSDILPLPGGRLISPLVIVIDGPPIGYVSIRRWREDVYFYASVKGSVTVSYGGCENRPSVFPPVKKPNEFKDISLGSPGNYSISLSPELMDLVGKKPNRLFKPKLEWELTMPGGINAGYWVALELKPEIIGAARKFGQGWWAVEADNKIVSSFIQILPLPFLEKTARLPLTHTPASPMKASGEIVWGDNSLLPNWASVRIQNHAEPLALTIEISRSLEKIQRDSGTKPHRPWEWAGSAMLDCGPWNQDCSTISDFPNYAADRILFTLQGKDLPPPKAIDVSLWNTRQRLVFPAPANPNVRLIYGIESSTAGQALNKYISENELPDELPVATIGRMFDRSAPKHPWDRILFIAALILAVAALLYLIVKLLPRRQEG